MSNVIQDILRDKEDIKQQLGEMPDTVVAPKRFVNSNSPKLVAIKQKKKLLDGVTLIWGSVSQGKWGNFKWGSDAAESFDVYAVLPKNNIFEEFFGQDFFISTNSTGTVDTTNETYTLQSGEFLESDIIAKFRTVIYDCTVYNNDSFTDDLKIEVSNDNGSNWIEVNPQEKLNFTTQSSSDTLKYRITNNGVSTVTLSNPIQIQVNS